jgi:hypothetical protein
LRKTRGRWTVCPVAALSQNPPATVVIENAATGRKSARLRTGLYVSLALISAFPLRDLSTSSLRVDV